MKTDDFINMLAAGAQVVDTRAATRRYSIALGLGTLGAALLMAVFLGVRPDLAQAVRQPLFWLKVAFVAGVALTSLRAVSRASRPGVPLTLAVSAILVPLLAMWSIAAFVLLEAESAQRSRQFFGDTWKTCPFLIAMLSAPTFVGVMWAMKGLAPTRPRIAGFVAGLLAGATAALVYSLHCPELQAPFVGFWYTLGILVPAALGALIGPWQLRW